MVGKAGVRVVSSLSVHPYVSLVLAAVLTSLMGHHLTTCRLSIGQPSSKLSTTATVGDKILDWMAKG